MALAQHSGGGGVSSKPKTNKATTTAAPSSGVNNPSTWAGMVETPTPSAAKPAATKPAVKPTFGQRVSNAINTIANAFKPNTTSVGKTSGVNNPSTWAGLVDTPTAPASKTTTTPVIKPASSSSSVRVSKPPKVGETITPSYTFLTIGDNAASGSEYNQQFNKNMTDYNTRVDNIFFSTNGQQGVDINDPVYLRTLKSDGEAFIAELEKNPNKYDEEFIRNSIGAITRNNRRITERLNLLQLGDTQDPEVQKEAAEVIRKYTSPSFRGSDGKLSKYDEANLIWAVNMIGDKAFASNNEQFSQVNGADQHLWWEKQIGSGAGVNKEYSGLLEDAVKVLQRDYGYKEDDPLIQYYNAMIADSKLLSDLYDKQAGELQGLSEDEQKKYIATYTAQQGVDKFNEDYWRSEIDRLREVADQQRAIALDESNSGKLDPTAAKEANAAANQAEALIDYYEQLISGVHDYEEMERLYNSSESTGESANVGSYLQKLNGIISDGKDELKTLQSELKTLKQEERSAAVQNDYAGMTQKQEEIKAKEAEIAQVRQTMTDAQGEIDHQERIMGLREMQVDFAREGKELNPASAAVMQDELAKYMAQVKAENRTLAGTARDYWDIAKAGAKMPVAGVLQFYTQGLKGLDALTTKIANYITGEDTSQGVMAESLSDVIQRMEDRLVEIQSDSSEETAGGLEGRGFIGKLIGSSIQSGEGIAFDKAYGAALNAATGNALGKHAGLVSMAQRVFGQSVSEAKAQEKATGEKAEHLYLDAIIDAAIEVGSEMLGGDAFSGTYGEGLLDTARKGMSKAVTSGKIKNILLPMGEEAMEEDVAFIAHRLVEFVMGKRDLSELAKMTEDDWEEFAISNLSAALLAGGDSVAMTIAKTSYGNTLQVHRDEILQKALETPENTPARQLAEKYKDDISKISDYDLYRLDAETKSQELQNDIKSTKNAVLSRLTALGEPTEQTTDILGTKEDASSLDKLADVIVLKTLGEDLSEANQKILDNSKYGQRVVNELDPENIKDGQTASDWVMDIESKVLHPEVYTHQREERIVANWVRSLGIKLSNKDISALTEAYRSGKSKDFSAYLRGLKDAILAANAGYHLEDTVSQHESIKNLTPHQRNVIWKVATEATHSEYRFDKNEPMTINGATGKLTKLTTRDGGMTAQLTDETTGEVHNVQLSKEDWNNLLKANPIIRTIYNEFNGLTGDIINAYNSDSDVPLSVYLENLRALKQAAKDSGMTWDTFTKSEAGQRIAANIPESIQRRVWNQARSTTEAKQTRTDARAANKSEAPSANYIRSKGTVTSEAQKFTINGKEYNLPAYDLSKAARGSKDYRVGKLIKGISQVTGVNIVLYENTSEFGINGAYDKKTKTLYLDMNRIGNNGEVLLTKTISHELTHFIQDESPEDYAALKQFITNKLMNKKGGRTYEQILQEKMDREGIGTEEASDEIVADGCEMMLKNSKAFRELAEENLTLAEKLRNHLVGLFGKLNKFYKGVDTDYEEARYLAQYSDRIQEMWDRGIKNASINLDAERKNAALQEFENQPARAAARSAVNAFAKNETRQMDRTEKAKGKSARFGKSPDEIKGQTTLDKNAAAEKRKATEEAKKAAEKEARNLREIPEQEDLFGEMDVRHSVGAFKQHNAAYDIKDYNTETKLNDAYKNDTQPTDALQFSVDSGLEALGFTFEKDGHRTVLRDQSGREIKKVDAALMENSPLGAVIKATFNGGLITEDQAKQEYKFLAEMVNQMLSTQDIDLVWAVNATIGFQPLESGKRTKANTDKRNTNFAALTSNSDPQYSSTIDFTTICLKTQAIIDAMSEVMKREGRGLSEHEIVDIVYKQTHEAGEPVPCPVCYVFSRWVGLGKLFDTMNNLQKKYPLGATPVEEATILNRMRKDMADLDKKIAAKQKELDALNNTTTKRGKAKEALHKELSKQYWGLKEKERLNKLTDEEQALLPVLEQQLEYLDNWTWMEKVRLSGNYKPVPQDILFDINAGNTFSTEYPESWKFRTTRGPAMGKAAQPYSPEHLGQIIKGIASKSALNKHTLGNLASDPFLKLTAKGDLTKTAKDVLKAARAKARVQNLLNGQRLQSTSDFRFEYGLDYLLAFYELQAIGSYAQLYTKVPEAVRMLASVGIEVNCSLMPYADGYDSNGNLLFSDVTGMHPDDAFALSAAFDNVQPIMVGVNRKHIELCMADDRITFIIPYHASGSSSDRYISMMRTVGEVVKARTDYSNYQTETERADATPQQIAARELRIKIVTGEAGKLSDAEIATLQANPILRQLYMRFYGVNEYGQQEAIDAKYLTSADVNGNRFEDSFVKGAFLNAQQAKIIMPYEFWDKTLTIDNADANGQIFQEYCESLGLYPRFSGHMTNGNYNAEGDFTRVSGYWKTLPDRAMYNNDGTYHEQQAVNAANMNMGFLDATKSKEGIVKSSVENNRQRTDEIANRSIAEMRAEQARSEEKAETTSPRLQFSFVRPSDDLIHKAELSEALGTDAITIWNEYGLLKGPDGKWRTELDDSRIRFYKNGNAKSSGHGHMLDDYLEFPELYEQYPTLKNIGVTENPEAPNIRTSFDPATGTININPNAHMSKDVKRLAVLHEVQHMIQRLEGWAADEYGYGEQEARLVEARHNLSKAQRRAMLPKLLSKINDEYMPLAKTGQEEAAQQLVDDAAHAAGYTEKVYHGSVNFGDHTVLETSGIDSTSDGGTYEWSPYFATDKLEIAKTYSGRDEARQIGKTGLKGNKTSKAELKSRATLLTTDLFTAIHNRFPNLPDSELEVIQNYCSALEYDLEDYIDGFLGELTFQKHLNNLSSNIFIALNDNKNIVKEEGLNWFLNEAWANAQTAISGIINDAGDALIHDRYGNYQYWVNTENFLVVEADFHKWHDLTYPSTGETDLTTREIAKRARDDGYSGVKILIFCSTFTINILTL